MIDSNSITEGARFLLQYLAKRGLVEAFVRNSHNDDNIGGDLEYILDMNSTPESIVDSAFIWGDTPEGHPFWSQLSRDAQQEFDLGMEWRLET